MRFEGKLSKAQLPERALERGGEMLIPGTRGTAGPVTDNVPIPPLLPSQSLQPLLWVIQTSGNGLLNFPFLWPLAQPYPYACSYLKGRACRVSAV